MPLAGCLTSAPLSANEEILSDNARTIVGTDLIGAKGLDMLNQAKIDSAIVGLCAAKAYTVEECIRHGLESRAKNEKENK